MSRLYLFYEEPDPDRWILFDRYPRRLVRRLVRGKTEPGGVMRWFLNLKAGLDQLGAKIRLNDYRGLKSEPGAWAYVVGKPHVIEKIPAGHPIIYGPAVAAHPDENTFWGSADIRAILISCAWFKEMYDRDLPVHIPTYVWPAGVETELWKPDQKGTRGKVVLVYDKVRWKRDSYEPVLVNPVIEALKKKGFDVVHIRYGFYKENEYFNLLRQTRAMVFLCEHETQGFAYLQALSMNVPILAWDRGGFWQDPSMYPDKVKFKDVTSVPYFDARCGMKFRNYDEFPEIWDCFYKEVVDNRYTPRDYIVQNFGLAKRAEEFLSLCERIKAEN